VRRADDDGDGAGRDASDGDEVNMLSGPICRRTHLFSFSSLFGLLSFGRPSHVMPPLTSLVLLLVCSLCLSHAHTFTHSFLFTSRRSFIFSPEKRQGVAFHRLGLSCKTRSLGVGHPLPFFARPILTPIIRSVSDTTTANSVKNVFSMHSRNLYQECTPMTLSPSLSSHT